jgi:hypothetical protein
MLLPPRIAVGAFADADFPPPLSVWEQTKHSWINLPEGMQHFPERRVSGAVVRVTQPG